jgi:hypothetical protein
MQVCQHNQLCQKSATGTYARASDNGQPGACLLKIAPSVGRAVAQRTDIASVAINDRTSNDRVGRQTQVLQV